MKKMLPGRKMGIALGVLALAVLGGCHKLVPNQPEGIGNRSDVAPPEPQPSETPTPIPPPPVTPVISNAVDADIREAPPEPDAQTQDDADATGMTSHVQRDEQDSGNEAQTQP